MATGTALLRLLIEAKDNAAKTLDKNRGSLKKLGKAAAVAGGAAALAAGAASTAAVKMALDFDRSMAEVKTLLPDLDKEGFALLKKSVLEFSAATGTATKDAIPALYQAISAGVPQENVFEFMKIASAAAIGGVTDLETAVDGITSVVNAYGADIIDAQKASDIMFTAVKLGKTDFNQLSKSLFNVIPTAASLGVSFEDIAAQLAVMTAQGVPTSVATTQIRAAFIELSKSGTKLSKFMDEELGTSFKELIASGKSTSEALNLVKAEAEKQGIEFNSLFGSVEAYSAALAITGKNSDKAADALAQMQGAAGATDKAFNTIADTLSFKMEKAWNKVIVGATGFGDKMLTIAPALGAIGPLMIGLTAAMPLMSGALGVMSAAWGVMGIAARAAWLAVTGPIGLVILGIAAAIAIGVLIWKNWDTIKAKAIEVFGFIERIFRSKWAWLLPGGIFIKAILFLKDNWRAIWDAILNTTVKIFDKLKGLANAFLATYLGIFNAIIGAWNSIEFKIPKVTVFGKTFGGGTISAPKIPLIPIPSFDRGGVVPGPTGRAVLVQARGGERFLGAGRSAQGFGSITNHFYGDIIGVDDLDRRISKTIRDEAARGGFSGVFAPAT